jgi:hypothetical protein
VVMVELGWVTTLLYWSRQTALNDDGEVNSWAAPATAAVAAAAADDAAAPQPTMERSPSQEMRVLLVTPLSLPPVAAWLTRLLCLVVGCLLECTDPCHCGYECARVSYSTGFACCADGQRGRGGGRRVRQQRAAAAVNWMST